MGIIFRCDEFSNTPELDSGTVYPAHRNLFITGRDALQILSPIEVRLSEWPVCAAWQSERKDFIKPCMRAVKDWRTIGRPLTIAPVTVKAGAPAGGLNLQCPASVSLVGDHLIIDRWYWKKKQATWKRCVSDIPPQKNVAWRCLAASATWVRCMRVGGVTSLCELIYSSSSSHCSNVPGAAFTACVELSGKRTIARTGVRYYGNLPVCYRREKRRIGQ